jgi:hypothetical protein
MRRLQGITIIDNSQCFGQSSDPALTQYIDGVKIFLQPDDGRKGQDEIPQSALVDDEQPFTYCR